MNFIITNLHAVFVINFIVPNVNTNYIICMALVKVNIVMIAMIIL